MSTLIDPTAEQEISPEVNEASLIGGIIYVDGVINNCIGVLEPSMFVNDLYRAAYEVCVHLNDTLKATTFNPMLVAGQIVEKNPRMGWQVRDVARMLEHTQAIACDRLDSGAVINDIRRLHRATKINIALQMALHADPSQRDNLLQEAVRTIQTSTVEGFKDSILTFGEAFEIWRENAARDESETGIYTGWRDFDRHLKRPLARGEVVAIAARAGVGKTHACVTITRNALKRNESAGALMVPLEMPVDEIIERMMAQSHSVDAENLRLEATHGEIKLSEVTKVDPVVERIVFYDRDITIQALEALIARSSKRGVNPRIVVIDYLGLIGWEGNKGAMGYEKTSDIARTLKKIAKATGTTIIVAVQLNREAGDGTWEPQLHHIRDSGSIEEACDRVLGMWKNPDGTVNIKVMKNRHGPTGGQVRFRYTKGLELVEYVPIPTVDDGEATD